MNGEITDLLRGGYQCRDCSWIFGDLEGANAHDCKDYNKVRALEAEVSRLTRERDEAQFWVSHATRFTFPDPSKRHREGVHIEARGQRNDAYLWTVTRSGFTLNSDGEWEHEPTPSSRDDDYIIRNRLPSKDAALERLRKFTPEQPK